MDRRGFLKGLGVVGAGATLPAVGAGLGSIQPRRHLLGATAPGDTGRPFAAAVRRRVVVVGGGLAGIVTALELARRNYDVALVEAAPHLGGKIAGWEIEALGRTFPVEHGFHGFFNQYYNLNEILEYAGVEDLTPAPDYPIMFADRPTEFFGSTTAMFPMNLLSVVRQSQSLRLAEFAGDGHGLYELMRYDPRRTFELYDGVDFATFCREGGINAPMVETVLEPFGETLLNHASKLSAAEAIRFFHAYFMGNPQGLGFRILSRDSKHAVVDPLTRTLREHGVQLHLGTRALGVYFAGDVARGVEVDARGTHFTGSVRTERAAIPEQGWHRVERADGSPVFFTMRDGQVAALDGRCTHMGCPIATLSDGSFRCPCHAGHFNAEGHVLSGPPQRDLAWLSVRDLGATVEAGRWEGKRGRQLVPGDYVVLACDTRGLRRLAESTRRPKLTRLVQTLGEADPYVVWRMWLDKPVRPDRRPFYTVGRHRFTDSVSIYSRFQTPYVEWAERTGGAVVESHAYAVDPALMADSHAVKVAMRRELNQLLPELAQARIGHDELMIQDNFTRFGPGERATRPSTSTWWPNLFLAGDHVRIEAPVFLMEAAAVSGRLAANAILLRDGVRQIPVWTVSPRGPLA